MSEQGDVGFRPLSTGVFSKGVARGLQVFGVGLYVLAIASFVVDPGPGVMWAVGFATVAIFAVTAPPLSDLFERSAEAND